MRRDTLGGFPYETKSEEGKIVIRFFPRPTAKYPDQSVLTLRLDENDVQKLQRILTGNRK